MSAPSLAAVGRARTFEANGCDGVKRLSPTSVRSSYPNCWMANCRMLDGTDLPEFDGIGELKGEKHVVEADADDTRLQKLWHQLRQAH
jgi:hypothetical protein